MGRKRKAAFFLGLVVPAAILLVMAALGSPHQAHADTWSTVTVDAEAEAFSTSIAVDVNGDAMISYQDSTDYSVKVAVCDLSESTNANCDQTGDWSTVTVDTEGDMGLNTSIAVDANGDPMISYHDTTNHTLKFAMCDRSASTSGNCDQTADWSTVIVDVGGDVGKHISVWVNANGDPMISYFHIGTASLRFAVCDRSASTNGNCDEAADWSKVTLDSQVPQ